MSFFSKESLQFLETLVNTPSPTGFEYTGQQVWVDYIKPYVDKITVDKYGTAVATINPKQKFSVVIEAHCDEISWFVNYISDKGMISVIRNGGSDHIIAPAKRVIIHGEKGPVAGVFGWPAIHTRSRTDEKKPEVETLFIDIGCKSKKEVEKKGVTVGSVITYPDSFQELNSKYRIGRAMDNRAGGFMIAQVARMLKENKQTLPFTLHIVNSVQEEIGLRGAQMIAHHLKPDIAIVTDVCHDTSTPMIDVKKEGDTQCRLGPAITVGPSVHNNLRKFVEKTATKKKIPFQRHAASTRTGTDTDAFAYTKGGIPSVLISLPVRYMHTTVEMIAKKDVKNTIKLIYESLCALTPNKKQFNYKLKK